MLKADKPADDSTMRSWHLFLGYFLLYPDQDWFRPAREGGLVSTVTNEPPRLNWMYVDLDAYEIKYGTRIESGPHLIGPWDCTKIGKRSILEGREVS